jgi:hypothetical protein
MVEMIGRKFGYLTVLAVIGSNGNGQSINYVKCDCGVEKNVLAVNLRLGRTKSCGCMSKKMISDFNTIHGYARKGDHKSEYTIWVNMVRRCANREDMRYGGKGITVCERWLEFKNFIDDMGPKPSPKHTIDRKESSLGYYLENCRWATLKEQAMNLRHTKVHVINGISDSIGGWCKQSGISRATYLSRVKSGWSAELSTPKRKNGKN